MQQFEQYIASLPVEAAIKKHFLHPVFFHKQRFYVNLCHYLAPLFPNIAENQLQKLSFASYLYFRFLLDLDHRLDSHSSPSPQHSFVQLKIHEEALRQLAYLFEETSPFWPAFEQVQQQYFATLLTEKKISREKPPFTQALFEQIAAGKSAVCLAIVHALNALDSEKPQQQALPDLLVHLHIAFQYIDDLVDFKKDIEEGQYTYIYHLTEKHVKEKYPDAPLPAPKQLHKYAFVSGLAIQMAQKARHHYQQAGQMAARLGLAKLQQFILEEEQYAGSYEYEVELLLQKTRSKALQSHQFKTPPPAKPLPALLQSIAHGKHYLCTQFDREHLWSDFMTSAGPGKHWVSAYTGLLLSETDPHTEVLQLLGKKLGCQYGNAYNDRVVEDGDSFSFLIGFLCKQQLPVTPQLLERWFSFSNPDGSWVTYRDAQGLRQVLNYDNSQAVNGWLEGKPCVSAAALYVLSLLDNQQEKFLQTAAYLLKNISEAGHWKAYWWSSPVYSTAFALMALAGHSQYRACCEAAAGWLVQQQSPEGSWQHSPFYTALAIKALLFHDDQRYAAAIQKSVDWLLHHQTTDGSWPTGRILQIPAPQVSDPEEVPQWRQSSFGVNTLVDDHNRVFSTATVINALHYFGSKHFLYDYTAYQHTSL